MGFGPFVKDVLVPLGTVVIALFVFLLNRSVSELEGEIQERQADLADRVEQRLQGQQAAELRFRVYEAVRQSLEAGDSRSQQVATALVVSMLSAEDSLRGSLLAVLQTAAQPGVRAQATRLLNETQAYATEQSLVSQTAGTSAVGDWSRTNIDIFWCVSRGSRARDLATRIRDRAIAEGAEGRVRVRDLSESINASPGYRISGPVIRYEANEEPVASRLKQIADGVGGGADVFLLQPITYRSPGYISLFAC